MQPVLKQSPLSEQEPLTSITSGRADVVFDIPLYYCIYYAYAAACLYYAAVCLYYACIMLRYA